jgi:hypothetical protein
MAARVGVEEGWGAGVGDEASPGVAGWLVAAGLSTGVVAGGVVASGLCGGVALGEATGSVAVGVGALAS